MITFNSSSINDISLAFGMAFIFLLVLHCLASSAIEGRISVLEKQLKDIQSRRP